jgi:hypothetical protein
MAPAANVQRGANRPQVSDQNDQCVRHDLIKDKCTDRQNTAIAARRWFVRMIAGRASVLSIQWESAVGW